MSAADPNIDIVTWFAKGWRDPQAIEQFCEHFTTRMHPDVVLIQPLAATGHGHDAFKTIFRRLFATIADLRAEVIRSCSTPGCVYLELDLRGRIGGLPVRWQTTDRLLINGDGLITERRSYFNPAPVVVALATRPWAWPQILGGVLRAAWHDHRDRAKSH